MIQMRECIHVGYLICRITAHMGTKLETLELVPFLFPPQGILSCRFFFALEVGVI